MMEFESIDEHSCMIALPFRDPGNDNISLFLKQDQSENFLTSDMGESTGFLWLHSVNPSTELISKVFTQLKNNFNITREGSKLILENISLAKLNFAILNFVQLMVEVMNYRILAKMRSTSISEFKKDVATKLDDWGVKYTQNYTFEVRGNEFSLDLRINGDREEVIYLDNLFATARGSANYRIMNEITKALVFYSFHSEGKMVVLMDDRDGLIEYWDQSKIHFLELAKATPLFWERDEDEFRKLILGNRKPLRTSSLKEFE